MAVVLALTSAACAARAAAPAIHSPAPFPGFASPPSLRPALPRVSLTTITPADIVATALTFQGVPYRYGGDDPTTGFDCSGYVRYVMGRHSVHLPRTAAEQFQIGERVSKRDIRPGDLVFFSTVAPGASHVGLALEGGAFVHAPATDGVVRVERLDSTYWESRFVGARRLFSE